MGIAIIHIYELLDVDDLEGGPLLEDDDVLLDFHVLI